MLPEKLFDAIKIRAQYNLEEQLELTRSLLRIPSVTGHEGPAQAYIADLYQHSGLITEVRPVSFEQVSKHPAYSGLRKSAEAYRGRPNVLGQLSGAGGGHSLVLNGHVDVVSPEPIGQWQHDPWGAEIEGDHLFGRGANDMKANLIANFMALRCLSDLSLAPEGDVILQSVIEEEAGGGGGTLALLLSGSIGDGIIISEPTNLGIRIGSGGVLYFRITVQGRTAHAGNAHLGVNAISHLIPIYQALEKLDQVRAQQRVPLFEAGSYGRSCHLNLGVLKAGDWPSTVPGVAVLEGRLGFLPGENAEDVKTQLVRTVEEASRGDDWLSDSPARVEWFGFRADPWLENADSPLVRTVQEVAVRVLKQNARIHARA